MEPISKTAFVSSPHFREHLTGRGHPETPSRLDAIEDRLCQMEIWNQFVHISPHPADLKWILKVHPHEYIDHLEALSFRRGLHYLDPDTPVSPRSFETSLLAAGGVLDAVDMIMKQKASSAFCAVRPPGHHAGIEAGRGFCLINHAAIASRYLQQQYGIQKIAIIDWDVHHGNGTQEIFYNDPTVFYFSVHQYPFYPGTGSSEEKGAGEGEGYTLNCPLRAGEGDKKYFQVFEDILFPRMETFRPQFVIISAGFDAHQKDPLGEMEVSSEGFGRLTAIVNRMAKSFCGGKIVSLLEGGYHPEALSESVEKHLTGLME